MGRILLLLIIIGAVVALAIAVLTGNDPVAPPSGDSADRDSAGDPDVSDPGDMDQATGVLVTATGRAVRMGSRLPLAKVMVSIGESEALSEADGSFSLLEVPTGEVEVHLKAEDLPPHVARLVLRETNPDLGEIAVPAETRFSGTVTGPGGAPVPGAVIRILERTRVEIGTWWSGPKYEQLKLGAALMDEGEPAPGLLTSTEGDGSFSVEGLSPGSYYFDVVAEGYAHSSEEDVKIPEGGSVERSVVLADGGTIRGKVLDSRRRGVGSAMLMVLPWNEAVKVPYAPIIQTASGPDGAFVVQGLTLGGEYMLLTRAPDGRIGLGIRVSVPSEDVELRVGPRFSLKGTVVDDETGAAITGATLFALLGSAVTDENGSYMLTGVIRSPFFRSVWISAEGYEDKQHEFDLAGSILGRPIVEEDFRLSKVRPGTLRVTARDLDGNVISGVALVLTEWGDGKPLARGVTRATGEAVLTEVPPSARSLQAMKPGYVMVEVHQQGGGERFGTPTENTWVRITPGGETAKEVTLAKTAEIKGRVIDQAGKPLSGVKVYANDADSAVTTNEKGQFTADRLPTGVKVGLNFSKEGYLDTAAQGEAGSGIEVEVTMARGGTLSGRVIDKEGKPLLGVKIIARTGENSSDNEQTISGSGGRFTIQGLAEGSYVLLADRKGFAAQKSESVDLRAGETREGIEIVLKKGVNVTIVAVLEDGTEVPSAAVVYGPLELPAEERMVFRRADRGTDRMEFRVQPGRYRVVATPLSPDAGVGAVEEELPLDQEGEVQVVLTGGRLGIAIKAKLPPGRKLAGMYLKRTEPAHPSITFWFRTEEDGVLRSPSLPPGKYLLTVYTQTEDGSWQTENVEDVEPSDRPLEVDLTR